MTLSVPSGGSGLSPTPPADGLGAGAWSSAVRRRAPGAGASRRRAHGADPASARPRCAARRPRRLAPRRRYAAGRARRPDSPLTSSSSSGARRAEDQRGDRVGDARVRQAVEPPQRDVGELARPRASRSRPARPSSRAPPMRGQLQRLADRQGARAAAPPAPSAWPARSSASSELASLEAAPSTPSPTGTPAASRSRIRQMPAPSRPLEDGQWATPVPVAASLRDGGVVEVHAVGQPDVVAEPAERVQVLDRRAAEALGAVARSSSAVSARWVCSRTPAPAGQLGRLGHQLAGDRERRAGRDADPEHRLAARVVERGRWPPAVAARISSRALDHVVGRQAACAGAEVHRAAGGVEPQPDRRAAAVIVAPSTSPPPRGKT